MSQKSKELKLHAVDTHMGLFDYTIRCVFGLQANAHKYVAYVFDDEDIEDALSHEQRGNVARGTTFYKTGYVPIVWMPAFPTTPREQATFAHEVIHAVNHLFDWVGIPYTKDTEEVFAHSVAHVIDHVMNNPPVKRLPPKRKKK